MTSPVNSGGNRVPPQAPLPISIVTVTKSYLDDLPKKEVHRPKKPKAHQIKKHPIKAYAKDGRLHIEFDARDLENPTIRRAWEACLRMDEEEIEKEKPLNKRAIKRSIASEESQEFDDGFVCAKMSKEPKDLEEELLQIPRSEMPLDKILGVPKDLSEKFCERYLLEAARCGRALGEIYKVGKELGISRRFFETDLTDAIRGRDIGQESEKEKPIEEEKSSSVSCSSSVSVKERSQEHKIQLTDVEMAVLVAYVQDPTYENYVETRKLSLDNKFSEFFLGTLARIEPLIRYLRPVERDLLCFAISGERGGAHINRDIASNHCSSFFFKALEEINPAVHQAITEQHETPCEAPLKGLTKTERDALEAARDGGDWDTIYYEGKKIGFSEKFFEILETLNPANPFNYE